MKNHSYSILIPSFNGLELLKKHLPSVIKHSPGVDSILIVDDGSTDGTAEYLAKNHPQINCLHHDRNLGFPKSVNLGFGAARSDLIVLLNNDVSPTKDYLPPALKHFENESVFAVTLDESTSSWPQVSWRGKLQYTKGEDKDRPRYSAWASGGSAVFRKSTWDKLGGFDEVYSPGYWEDIDIGWRAWKAGYRIIWEPEAKVVHQHESTFNLLSHDYINLIKQRNELLFNWKNITDPTMRREHFVYLLRHTLAHPGYLKVILAASASGGKKVKTEGRLTDRDILALVNQPVS